MCDYQPCRNRSRYWAYAAESGALVCGQHLAEAVRVLNRHSDSVRVTERCPQCDGFGPHKRAGDHKRIGETGE